MVGSALFEMLIKFVKNDISFMAVKVASASLITLIKFLKFDVLVLAGKVRSTSLITLNKFSKFDISVLAAKVRSAVFITFIFDKGHFGGTENVIITNFVFKHFDVAAAF
jgi:hypothetical protein